jgi:hypothetical protein
MLRPTIAPLLIVTVAVVAGTATAAAPSAETLVERAIAAADPDGALATHDVIRLAVHEEETAADGTSRVKDLTVLTHGGGLENVRLEIGNGISIVLNGSKGWAMIQGQLDARANAARMAAGTVRQRIFPLLFPFSLQLDGIQLGTPTETTFDGKAAWAVDAVFTAEFFASPSLGTEWRLFFDRETAAVLGAEYLVPTDLRAGGSDEGGRYRILARAAINGITLPTRVLLDGIDANGAENGHFKVTKISHTGAGVFDPTLFLHPDELKKHDEGEIF